MTPETKQAGESMNASEQHQRPASEALGGSVPVDSSRRRFARIGLSGSVVLGSLVSKPVLGAVPYHCTVSGQVSGNLSRPGLAADCVLGQSPTAWHNATSWPSNLIKGTPPDKDCKFKGSPGRGTNFNGYTPGGDVPALIAAFFNVSTGTGQTQACSVTLTATATATPNLATMLQVLALTNTGEQFVLGRVVVTSLLNAASLGITYPVTTHTIIAMFNATFGGGTYPVTTTNSWSRTRVIEYLQSLYAM